MKKLKTPLSLLLVLLLAAGVCGVFVTANATPDSGEATYYEITFALPDGSVICSETVPEGETPVYNGPRWVQNDYFDYWLTGWTPDLAPAYEDAVYVTECVRRLRIDEGAKSRLRGDANGDGAVDILDATTIQRYLAGLYSDPYDIINVLGITADESRVTILDATRIQRYLAGFKNIYHIGEIIEQDINWPGDSTEPPTEEPTEEPTAEPTQAPTISYELPPI